MLTLQMPGDDLPEKILAEDFTILDISIVRDGTDITKQLVWDKILILKKNIVACKLADEVARCINLLAAPILGTAKSCLTEEFSTAEGDVGIFVTPASSNRYWEDRNTSRDDFAIAVNLIVPSDDVRFTGPAFTLFQDIENGFKGRLFYFGHCGEMTARFERMVYDSPVLLSKIQGMTGYYDSEALEKDVCLSMSCVLFFNRWLTWHE